MCIRDRCTAKAVDRVDQLVKAHARGADLPGEVDLERDAQGAQKQRQHRERTGPPQPL